MNIVTLETGFETKGISIYVESTSTVYNNLLFYVHTLWLNNLRKTFLLISCSNTVQNLL